MHCEKIDLTNGNTGAVHEPLGNMNEYMSNG